MCIHTHCSFILCPCFRHDESTEKKIDMTICYSHHDEDWLHEKFMTQLSQYDRGYKIHKLNLPSFTEEHAKILRKSKRIVLMCSEAFLRQEWSSKKFCHLIKEIYFQDASCILVAVDLRPLMDHALENALGELRSNGFADRCGARIRHAFGLNKIEVLNWTDVHVWKEFNYIMPFDKYNEITKISNSLNAPSFIVAEQEAKTRTRKSRGAHKTRHNHTEQLPSLSHIVSIPEDMRIHMGQLTSAKSKSYHNQHHHHHKKMSDQFIDD